MNALKSVARTQRVNKNIHVLCNPAVHVVYIYIFMPNKSEMTVK